MSSFINLLVIEDKPADFRLIVRHLEQQGLAARCHCVSSIEELEASVAEGGWDAVLSDYSVPKLDFQHTLGVLQATHPDVPLILVSGTVGEEKAVELLKQGVWDFVLKDSLTRLVPAIERSLRDAADRRARRRAEVALQESEKRFRTLFAAMTEGMGLHELLRDAAGTPVDYVLLDVNPAFTLLTGLGREAVVGRRASEIFGGEAPHLETYADVAITGRATRFEAQSESMKKTFSISAFSPAQGKFATVFEDITARRQASAALAASEERHRGILDASPVPLAVNDGKHITYLNRAFMTAFGYTREDIPTLAAWWALAYPDPQYRQVVADTWTARLEQARQTGHPIEPLEAEIRCKDGTVRTILAGAASLAEGKYEGEHLAVLYDITERKRAEQSHARLAMAVEQAAETVVITDTEGRILYSNPAFEKSSGYTCAEALGQNPRVFKSGKQNWEFYRQMWEVLQRGEVWQGHFTNRRKDGTLYEEEATISPVRDGNGTVINYVAVKRDVTHEMQLEAQFRQAQKMEAFGQLAGGVAHDFNNILTVILGNAGLLSLDMAAADAEETLGQICAAAERASALTRQLLLFSRKQVMQLRDLELNASIGHTIKILQRMVGEDVAIRLQLSPQPLWVHADPGMMDQVLMNLAVNARDAMPQGGQILIETTMLTIDEVTSDQHPGGRPGAFACLSVADAGTGIPPEILPQIFEPFFTTKDVGKGTGLGLATVFGIVEQHRGWIDVQSEVGRGTLIRIYLPRVIESGKGVDIRSELAGLPGGNETILLVEDDPAVRLAMKKLLAQLGYQVLEAHDGASALEMWRLHGPKVRLLLTDLVMPGGMTGIELSRQLQRLEPGIKVIYTSGYSATVAGKTFPLQEGVNFVAKPIAAEGLAKAVRSCLDKR